MTFKEFRDSWEVWRRKVSGGSIEIHADDVEYDGTQSGLSATNAQGAIDELAGELNTINVRDAYVDGTKLYITTNRT